MATETILWTAIPNGIITTENGRRIARISVVASHRLEAPEAEGDTLSLYRITRHWTRVVADMLQGFIVRMDGIDIEARLINRAILGPEWWEGMFNDDTFVRPYAYNDLTDKLIISYPTIRIREYIKKIYQQVGFESPNELPDVYGRRKPGSTGNSVSLPSFPFNKEIAAGMRAEMKAALNDTPSSPSENIASLTAAPVTGDPVRDMQQLMLFHYPANKLATTLEEDKANETIMAPPLPSTEEDFERYMDFHEVISSLGDYPVLMRRLGLVIDIGFPIEDLPGNPFAIQVAPVWGEDRIADNLISEHPRTVVDWDPPTGVFRSRSRDGIPAIQRGQLAINPNETNFDLVQVDVDGVAIKLANFFNGVHNTANENMLAADSPRNQGFPTIRSAGFSLNETARDLLTYMHFNKTKSDNDQLIAGGGMDLLLYAEDLLRGYRVDIWDTLTRDWHSLCRRIGSYVIEGTDLVMEDVADEGFAQMAMSQPAETEEGQPPATDDIYLHESMFRWDGWSLVAPRPGKTIGEQGDGSPAVDPEPQPMMPFKLITQFRAAPRSLPRLRFGAGYRMRVRVADLAGNSVSLNDAANDLSAPSAPDKPEVYYRYEPLSPPSIFPLAAITEDDPGESVRHMVIRSFNQSPELDNVTSADVNERHIAAPPASVLMAEIHGAFDDLQGRLKNDPATYNLISSRDNPVNVDETSTPIIPDAQMILNYLPDPLAMGAAIRDLPGTTNKTWGKVDDAGQLLYEDVPGVLPREGTTTHIPFLPTEDPVYPDGLIALYTFEDGEGDVVHDVSGSANPVNLTIADPANVTWGSHALTIDAPTIISTGSAPTSLMAALQTTHEVSVEMWVQPASDSQSGPARLMSLSADTSNRNLMVGQSPGGGGDARSYAARVRTTATDANGLPTLFTPDNIATTNLTHIVFTRDQAGTRTLYIDGVTVVSDTVGGDFSNWDMDFRLALANEFTGDRPWLGTYHMLGIYNRALPVDEVLAHFNNGTSLPMMPPDAFDRLLANMPFRIAIAEHESGTFALPGWDHEARVLNIYLPKAEDIRRPISTYMHAEHLKLMGVWAWIREHIDKETQLALSNPALLESLTKKVVDCVQYALEGGHWMITPSRQLAMVHAVQQPIGQPNIVAMLAQRDVDATNSEFGAIIQVHGKSTLTLNLLARWTENVDDLNEVGPTLKHASEAVEEIKISSLEGGTLKSTKLKNGFPQNVGTYQPAQDWVLLQKGISPEHEFGDTKHREVDYHIVAGSRFREYFPANVEGGFTRDTNTVSVHVPSSARPAAPRVRYMLPTYGWKREETTNIIGSYRQGGGLRVYMDRPWFSSGDGELLGVVLWQGSNLSNADRHTLKRYITQWGIDPIHVSENIAPLPHIHNFPNSVRTMSDLHVPELAGINVGAGDNPITVVGFPVHYNEERGLWFSDIDINMGEQVPYMPFVRLALVRFQPWSVEGMHLSPIVLADFAQIAPDRSAILTWDPYEADMLNLVVSGYTYRQSAAYNHVGFDGNQPITVPINDGTEIVVQVQERDPDLDDELAWSNISTAINVLQTNASQNVLWQGRIRLPADREPGQYRVVITELERLYTHSGTRQPRLVYADTIEV
ncbi:LamG domain-containing protein [Phototrophicus methaneseepsis]|uniref:LamG domain-containing protein n=1 Tax=Phototrophicus methaneseepsis TaxID=2710758 RepID=A0A7S8IE75_9CHLR|nr:LamG domain-containing protein [Phototrophicus methaneseepsis]QPC83370.1 LamG domain-containing protein [Phototrophicus methaneseepsis]